MNKTTAAAVVLIGTVAAVKIRSDWKGCLADLQGRFPDLDHKTIRKAYTQFLKNALTGKTSDLSDLSDKEMDVLFLAIVKDLTDSK